MRNKRVAFISLLILSCAGLFASGPWATIAYAEGKTFMLVRDGKTATYSVDSDEVFGMELRQGDVIQTSASTFLEISITSVQASVQVAENTSFKCDADKDGSKVSSELYYGRVRAKVAKLAGSSSFRITTPTLVAGVRGTDFGCDVIAVRGAKVPAEGAGAQSASSTPVVNRVFCFEGTVAVEPSPDVVEAAKSAGKSVAEPVLISKNEMVEKVVADGAVPLLAEPLKKNDITDEVSQFWEERPFVEIAPVLPVAAAGPPPVWPKGREEKPSLRNLTIPAVAAAILMVAGTAACAGTSYYSANFDSGAVWVDPVYSAGIVMVSSGTILALVSSLFD